MELHEVRLQKTSVFFVFDRIIKDPDPYILKYAATRHKDEYKSLIDTKTINTLEIDTLLVMLIQRNVVNPLRWSSIAEFDYDAEYKKLYDEANRMYIGVPKLPMCRIIQGYIHDFKVSDIYIWNQERDPRQEFQLVNLFPDGKDKIKYITGDYERAIKSSNPSLIYDWSLDRIANLNSCQEHNDRFFGIANYGFNFEDDEHITLKYGLSTCRNIAFFIAYKAPLKAKFRG